MAQKTSVNIKPCNIGSSEAHNRRTVEYLAHIGKEKFYVRTDLMAANETWVAPDFGGTSLSERYNQIAAMVKEKTGRAMQTKDRERMNKKTGKVTIVRGSTPLKEGVVVIKDDTTLEQLQHFCEVCKERWGITALQIFIHRDEGHYCTPGDTATWKPNLHAHIVWDWMNHDTGKSCKLDEKAMSEMQTLLAECLEMERGTSKEVTGKEHLERADFIIAKQKHEIEQLIQEHIIKEEHSAELDNEIEEKKRKVNTENGNIIISGMAYMIGKGKFSEMEKENERLKSELPKLIALQKEQFDKVVDNQVAKKVASLNEHLKAKTAETIQNRQQWLVWQRKANLVETELETVRMSLQSTIELQQAAIDLLAIFLMHISELFRKAVQMVIDFAQSKYQSILHNEQAAVIKQTVCSFTDIRKGQEAIGSALVNATVLEGKLDKMEEEKVGKEVESVISGEYDYRIGRNNNIGY
ncbi:mobilization protein [Bacteroides acidifaciens]|uniref:mobilization protein n=1 Tax=Bacteroides acidifaciens TaxID=85831 RepID=UPI00272B7C7C|nr:mobilization protein [Bacteroides acidifaciens]